jgi:hypothetical protein
MAFVFVITLKHINIFIIIAPRNGVFAAIDLKVLDIY